MLLQIKIMSKCVDTGGSLSDSYYILCELNVPCGTWRNVQGM